MGMDMVIAAVAWSDDTELDAEAGERALDTCAVDELDPAGIAADEDIEEVRQNRKNDLRLIVEEAQAPNRRDTDWLKVGKWTLLLSGGGSWGDAPTDFFEKLQDMPESALRAAGFDWPESS